MNDRIAIYARFSSSKQHQRSIVDQQRLCVEFAAREVPDHASIRRFEDSGISGASMHGRLGLQDLLAAVHAKEIDVVICESLDRLSRDREDTAGLFKRITFAGVRLMTVEDGGDVGDISVGVRGTMNKLYLTQLAAKTRRGLRGRIEAGRSGGGRAFGYRTESTANSKGVMAIEPSEADTVRRIFTDYVAGLSPKHITKALNAEGVRGPSGVAWSPSTIHGHRSAALES